MSKISLVKHDFFKKSSNTLEAFSFKEYDFDLYQLKSEFLSLYLLFLSNKNNLEKDSEVVLYLNFLCDLLIRYYQCDYVREDLQTLGEYKKEIDAFINENSLIIKQKSPIEFPIFLLDIIRNNVKNYVSSLKSTSKLREHISNLNTNRSYWNYSRTLACHVILLLKNSGFTDTIKGINNKIGHHYSPDNFIILLDKPREILRVLSVGLNALRFMLNSIATIKHIIQATINKELSSKKVFNQEMEKRAFIMINDMVWSTVNLLINYKEIFHLSSRTISQLTLIFLTFDAALWIVSWSFEAHKHHDCTHELMVQKKIITSSFELLVINRQLEYFK